jgi:hypothetical protein
MANTSMGFEQSEMIVDYVDSVEGVPSFDYDQLAVPQE